MDDADRRGDRGDSDADGDRDDQEWGTETAWDVDPSDDADASAGRSGDVTGHGPDGGYTSPVTHLRLVATGLALVVVAFVLGLLAVLAISYGLILGGVEITDTTALFVSLIGIQGIGFPLAAFGYLAYIDRDVGAFIPIRWPSLKEIGLAIAAAIGALLLVILFASVVLSFVETEPATNTGGETVQENPWIVPYLIPFVFLLNGPGEELLFRGVLQGRFREVYGPAVAIVLASLMFAPAHILSLTGSLQAAALTISFLTVPSLVFGAVYEYTDNFVVPALVHSIYNSILFGSVYLASRYGPDPEETAGLLVF